MRRWRCSSLVAAAGVAAVFASGLLVGGARSASEAPGLIAFTRWDGIYVMRADGSGIRALRRGGVAASASGLAWSPDGRRLAFAADHGIWVMGADGGGLVRLVDARAGTAMSPTWSPDGRRIAYGTFLDRGRLWVMNADGSNQRLLVTRPPSRLYAATGIDWSPTSGRVAFTTGGWQSSLYVVNTNGSRLRELPNATRVAYQPEWSPDGHRIAFTHAFGASGGVIAVIDPDHSAPVQFLTNGDARDTDPTWSGDGRGIAFLRSEGSLCLDCPPERRSSTEIFFMNPDGAAVKRLTHNLMGEGSPAWQPVAPS